MIAKPEEPARLLSRLGVAIPLCVVLVAVCALATKVLFIQGLAAHAFDYSDREDWRETAANLDPTASDYSKALGDRFFRQVLPPDPRTAIGHYRNALLRSPYDAIHWLDWASVNNALGDKAEAGESLLIACEFDPNNALVHKQYGDLLLERGDIDGAIASHSKAILLKPEAARPLCSLYWSLGLDPLKVARRLIGSDSLLLRAYLLDCMTWVEVDQMHPLWTELRSWNDEACDSETHRRYFDYLIVRKAYDAARETWGDIVERFYGMSREEANKPFWNGQLDVPVRCFSGGLEWRISDRTPQGVRSTISNSRGTENMPSIWLHFDGKENVNFSHVWHYFFVEPGKSYRLSCHASSLNITTDNGPLLRISLIGDKATHRESKPVTGTGQRIIEIEFQTSEETEWARLTIVRKPSGKMNNMIGGDAWFSDFSLEELETTAEEPTEAL